MLTMQFKKKENSQSFCIYFPMLLCFANSAAIGASTSKEG